MAAAGNPSDYPSETIPPQEQITKPGAESQEKSSSPVKSGEATLTSLERKAVKRVLGSEFADLSAPEQEKILKLRGELSGNARKLEMALRERGRAAKTPQGKETGGVTRAKELDEEKQPVKLQENGKGKPENKHVRPGKEEIRRAILDDKPEHLPAHLTMNGERLDAENWGDRWRDARKFFRSEYKNAHEDVVTNNITGEEIHFGRESEEKPFSHTGRIEQLIVALKTPKLIPSAVYLGELPNEKNIKGYKKFEYFLKMVKVGDTDFAVKITVGVDNNGLWHYDNTTIEAKKEDLLSVVRLDSLSSQQAQKLSLKDKRIEKLLQGIFSDAKPETGNKNETKSPVAKNEPETDLFGEPKQSDEEIKPRFVKGQSFKTDEGNFSYYNPEGYNRKNGDMFTVSEH